MKIESQRALWRIAQRARPPALTLGCWSCSGRPVGRGAACALDGACGRDTGPAISVALDLESLDGDEAWNTAQQTLAQAGTEREKLQALVTVVNLQRRRGDYTAGLVAARDGLVRARELRDVRLEVDFLYLLGRLYWNLTTFLARWSTTSKSSGWPRLWPMRRPWPARTADWA